jgi:hypothetical protein
MKNLLVEYKGGGYNGSFWEWNYFMFDSDGDFVNLISTGYKGLDGDAKDIALGMAENPQDHLYDGITVCNLDNEDDIKEFIQAGNSTRMKQLSEMNELLSEKMVASCDKCNKDHNVCDMIADDYSGDGGVAISAKSLYCEYCYYSDDYFPLATLKYGSYELKIGEMKPMSGYRSNYEYALFFEGDNGKELLFSGDDFSPSPMDDIQSLGALSSLLGFLTIGIDDTDDDYFENYTKRQFDFAKDKWGDREYLSCLVYDIENDDIDDYYDIEESYGKYDDIIFLHPDK